MGVVSSAATWFTGLAFGWKIAVVAGAIVVIVGTGVGCYKLYKYCTKTDEVS